jgi:hypothetical protein
MLYEIINILKYVLVSVLSKKWCYVVLNVGETNRSRIPFLFQNNSVALYRLCKRYSKAAIKSSHVVRCIKVKLEVNVLETCPVSPLSWLMSTFILVMETYSSWKNRLIYYHSTIHTGITTV